MQLVAYWQFSEGFNQGPTDRLSIPLSILSEIFMQINQILTKLCRLKLGGPVTCTYAQTLSIEKKKKKKIQSTTRLSKTNH